MSPITYCLMCLGTEVRMYQMNTMMRRIYNDLITTPPPKEITQMYACYECAYLLYKFDKFKTKCWKVYNILCSLSPEPFEVTQECLNSVDRKQNELVSLMTSLTSYYDYRPNQKEIGEHEEYNVEKVESEPITFDNKLTNDEDDPLQIMQEMQLDIKNTLEHVNEDKLLLDVKNIPKQDVSDYQFKHTFQVESSKSDAGSMLWLTIQSKENTEENNKGSSSHEDQECLDTIDNHDYLDNYFVEQKHKIHIESENDNTKNSRNKKIKTIKLEKKIECDIDDNENMKDITKKNKNRSYDVSDTDIIGLLSLDSKILNDHMTVIDLTPDDARREFLLRKKSSNYTRNPFKCDLCYRGFLSKTSYESHLKKHSSKNGPFQCDICKLRFIGKLYLNTHRTRTHRRKFSCKMCPYVCFAQTQCNAHILSHRGQKYTCKKCGMTYRYRNSLLTHMHVKHSEEHVCEFCGSTFASENGLLSHQRLVHRQERNEYLGPKCDECDVHFASELAWKRHRVLCSRHEVQFGCKVCGEVFWDSDSFKAHSREHGAMDCGARKNYLVKTCKFCKIGLPNKIALKNHLMNEHPTEVTTDDLLKPKTEKSYICEFCGKAFPKIHSDEMPYSCPDCGMRTKYKDYLTIHRRNHTEEYVDRFQCDLCGRPFSDKGRLARHMKGHMGIRPFKCVACDKTFMFRCDERNHYKHVHDKEPYPKKNEPGKRTRRKAPHARIKLIDNI